MRQKKQRPSKKPGFSEEPAAFTPEVIAPSGPPKLVTVVLAAGGRVVIPAPMRSALGMKIGDRLTVRLEGNELRIHTYEEGLRQANALVDKYLPEDSVEEFCVDGVKRGPVRPRSRSVGAGMNDVILDASAIIAVLKRETGDERVADVAEGARVSALTIAEVATWLVMERVP